MVDGSAALMMMFHAFRAMGIHDEEHRGTNLLDSGAHFYDVYETADGEWVSIGSIEPQFYAELLRLTGLEGDDDLPWQMDKTQWGPDEGAAGRASSGRRPATSGARSWRAATCASRPVLRMSEAAKHPHNVARQTFLELDGVVQPAPAPRFSRTPGAVQRPPAHAGQHTDEVLAEWLDLDADAIAKLRAAGAVA